MTIIDTAVIGAAKVRLLCSIWSYCASLTTTPNSSIARICCSRSAVCPTPVLRNA